MSDEQKLICEICGENDFITKEGFHYCNECGTQSQYTRDIVFDEENQDITERRQKSTIKIQKLKTNKDELTSWECFNYLLRGLVEELLQLGAKEELKLVTLQLWTHYLKVNEIAFFNKNQVDLPKLSPRYSLKDAAILYNQSRLKRKRKRETTSNTLGKRVVQAQKRKFIESEYEKLSQSEKSSYQCTSSYQNSSSNCTSSISNATTSRAIRLTFTSAARKYFKKKMNVSHLSRHENDQNNELNCHRIHKAPKLKSNIANSRVSRQTIYSILYLALNLIEDDFQLSDILRFMREGHLTSKHFKHFFPEDVANNCEKILQSKIFYSKRHIFLDISIRTHAAFLCRLMNIKELKTPNLYKLIERYVIDLNLPAKIIIYIERLINLCPKQKIPLKLEHGTSPFYEARAMALIIFVLKLLFGLDDNKENLISKSAKNINEELKEIGETSKELFIWNDWVKFIEMRKIILSQCHSSSAVQYKKYMNTEQYLNQLDQNNEDNYDDDSDTNKNNLISMQRKRRLQNIQSIFEGFIAKIENKDETKKINLLKFGSSLTPNYTYLQEILNIQPDNLYIPEFMYVDHSKFDIKTFVKATKLQKMFKSKRIQLNVKQIELKSNCNYIGIFRNFDVTEYHNLRQKHATKVNYDINEEEWIENVLKNEKKDIIECSQNKANFQPVKIQKKCTKPLISNDKNLMIKNESLDEVDCVLADVLHNSFSNIDTNIIEMSSIKSFDVFSEMNMNPLDDPLFREPRRNLDYDNIFAELSDDDDDNDNTINDSLHYNYKKSIELNISNFDYWFIYGNCLKLNDKQLKQIKEQFPKSFLWLLNTCSSILGIDWIYLFKELLIIENYFSNVLEPFDNNTSTLKYQSEYKSKDMKKIVNYYKDLW